MNFDKKISLFLIILLVIAVAVTVYITVVPNPGEKFTEFYILGSDQKAGNYPTQLTQGQTGNVFVGMVNHEHTTTTYNLQIKLSNATLKNENYTLADNEKKVIPFSFQADKTGNNQKLEFLLYKLPDNANVYRWLDLMINVS